MATVNREAIDTFMSITGASETIAIERLEASFGNLNEAVNAHFSEGDRNILQEAPVTATPNDLMDIDDTPELEPRGLPSLLSAARGVMNPFSLLDHSSELLGRTRGPYVSQPREVREIPIEVRDGHGTSTVHGPRIEDVSDSVDTGGPETHGTIIIDEEDDDDIPGNLQGNRSYARPSAPHLDDTSAYGNDIEEEMIRAAIEASKRDTELQNTKTAEQDKLQREPILKVGVSGSSADKPFEVEELSDIGESNQRQGVGSSSNQYKREAGSSSILDEADELDEHPLIRHRSILRSSGSVEVEAETLGTDVSPALSPPRPTASSQTQPNGNAFLPHEWGGISSEEHDEAVMLEAAMFGGVPENGYRAPYVPQLMGPGLNTTWTAPRPPSPNLVAQRSIREQQDDEYLASLQADREKEMKALAEEAAAREAAVEKQKREEEEAHRKLQQEQELERQLAVKRASLPEEPTSNDENAVNLMVKMPDGSRYGRQFRKSDKLQSLFDFIDVGRMVKPGTYRVVRPYPRQAFSDGESNLTLNELGLTSKQEALFLESI